MGGIEEMNTALSALSLGMYTSIRNSLPDEPVETNNSDDIVYIGEEALTIDELVKFYKEHKDERKAESKEEAKGVEGMEKPKTPKERPASRLGSHHPKKTKGGVHASS